MARLKALPARLAAAPSRDIGHVTPGSWRSGKTTTERGYGYRWQKARERYLMNHPLCVYCERNGAVTVATVLDHIRPHRGDQGLFWDKSNWQGLCASCHSSVKQAEESGTC